MNEQIIEKKLTIPEGVTVEVTGREITAKKGNKAVKKKFRTEIVTFRVEGNEVIFQCEEKNKKNESIVNTFSAHVRNMFIGLDTGYYYKLRIVYSHFPISIQKKEKIIEIHNFIGEKKPRTAGIVGDTTVDIKGKEIVVKGPSKDDTSQTAANIETNARVKNKDLRIYQDGIYLVEKGMGEPSA